ncbi:MAG: hypothetical protein ACFFEM_01995 [Candidatus Thorarchaeota archaeon]
MILQPLQEFINIITLGKPWIYEANDEEVLKRLDALAEYLGKGADKKLLKKLRKILESGKIEDKRKFVISSIPSDTQKAETIKNAFKQATDLQVHMAFYFYAVTKLEKPKLKERRERLRHKTESYQEPILIRKGTDHPVLKQWEKENAIKAQAFHSSISEFAEALEKYPDNIHLWANLASYLAGPVGKDYLAKAAQSVVNKDIECHVRTKRELAKLLIDSGAPRAAEVVLDGAALDPFA